MIVGPVDLVEVDIPCRAGGSLRRAHVVVARLLPDTWNDEYLSRSASDLPTMRSVPYPHRSIKVA
jgi:hypothetical protein